MRVEFKCTDRSAIVDLGGTDAPFPHFLLLSRILSNHFASTPQSYRAIFHTTSNDTMFVQLINPIKGREPSGTERVADECYKI